MLEFLGQLYEENVGYSAINTAKSAISSMCAIVAGREIGNERIVKQFMKGIFTCRPALPKYGRIWDVNKVFVYLSTLSENANLSLLELSQKLAILLMLLSGQRCQTIHMLKIGDIHVSEEKLICHNTGLLKQSKPGTHLEPLEFLRYTGNRRLCVVQTMIDYLKCTTPLRGTEQQLFITTVPPYKAVSRSTVSRWIKQCMEKAGIDISVFTAHSCRAAATSAATAKGLPIDIIMRAAGWSSADTFRKFYKKPIDNSNFGSVVIDTAAKVHDED